jgi:uncharacterized protein (UPF0548 family)
MLSLRRLGPTELEALVAEARLASPTYEEIGASRADVLPKGFHHVRMELRVGDEYAFERAVLGLRTWVAHEGAGLRIYPKDPVVPDATVIAVKSIGPLQMAAPCRIVAVFKEPDVFGFSYGTLPGHPESGEESFVLERRGGATHFTVRAFSKPVDPLARLAGPVGQIVQRSVSRHYLIALRRFVASDASTTDS